MQEEVKEFNQKVIYILEKKGNNSDLTLIIKTTDEGIEAKKIEIYSGNIKIESGDDGINAASSGEDCGETVQCSGTCAVILYIMEEILR